jgi:Phosphoserine phosphatase RsbU, N-terminal domain
MGSQTALFSRRYRAALLDYLLGSGEAALARAYDLGRTAIDEGMGLLPILRAHQEAIQAVLQPTLSSPESLKRLTDAEDFLMEILSSFEMTYRGYVALLEGQGAPRDRPLSAQRRTDRHKRRSH